MSSRFRCVSCATRRTLWTDSKSCLNTIDDGLDLLEIAVDAGRDLASRRALACDVFTDRADLREIPVNQGAVFRFFIAHTVGCRCFGHHSQSLPAGGIKAMRL